MVDQWLASFKQRPYGDDCLYLALIASMFFNANIRSKETEPVTVEDIISHVEWIKAGSPTDDEGNQGRNIDAYFSAGLE